MDLQSHLNTLWDLCLPGAQLGDLLGDPEAPTVGLSFPQPAPPATPHSGPSIILLLQRKVELAGASACAWRVGPHSGSGRLAHPSLTCPDLQIHSAFFWPRLISISALRTHIRQCVSLVHACVVVTGSACWILSKSSPVKSKPLSSV